MSLVLVIMGVSGSGKTTVGEGLAERLGWPFFEGDDYHPEANVEKMEQGEPLTDEDRRPWLENLRDVIDHLVDEGRSGVITCSALKASYRRVLREGREDTVRFVYLEGSYEVIRERMEQRKDHFFDAGMLKSQFEALEPPAQALTVRIDQPPGQTLGDIMRRLDLPPGPG